MRDENTIGWSNVAVWVLLSLALQVSTGQATGQSSTSRQAEYDRAESLIKNRRWDEGLEAINRVLSSDPGNLKALNLAGIACSSKGDRSQADRYFERALKLNPRFTPALKNLSVSEFNAHQYPEAEKHLLAAQKQLPDDATINVYLGEIAFIQQHYELAAERLNRAGPLVTHNGELTAHLTVSLLRSGQRQQALDLLKPIKPTELDPRSQLAIGVTLAESDSNEEAIPYLAEAFEHDPNSVDAGFDLALVCVRAKRYGTAIATLQRLIDRAHDSSELEDLLAEALASNGDTKGAFDAYRKAIALNPSDENNYLDFASLCMDHRGFDDAMEVVMLGLRRHPESEQLTYMRGIIEASQDNFDLAEKDFQQAALLNPRHDFGAVGLGSVYLQRGNSAAAIEVTRAELQKKPDDANLLYLLGEGILASGAAPGQPVYAEAQQSLERAVRLNPALCLPHIALGSIHLREQRYSEAARQFEAARALDPNENSAYSHLAVTYRHLGEPEKAKAVVAALQGLLDRQRSGAHVPANAALKSP